MAANLMNALALVFSMEVLPFIALGTTIGIIVGLLPGLGGLAGMAILMPFLFGMEPLPAIGMLVGMIAVTSTSDTIPSVLLGIPGSASAQATIVDGYPLAQKGQARRALEAAFTVSMFGGIFGALVLLLILPIARPVILALGSPQLFMLTILGITLVGTLATGSPIAGLLAGLTGLILSTVGPAPASANPRFTMGFFYLYDGIPLVLLALGLFALPEFIDLLDQNRRIASGAKITDKRFEGVRDAWRNKGLVLASSASGVALGMLPGLGGSVIDWITYGGAKRFCRDTQQFGHGDIRGVIAPESANNSKEGGALIPTLLFGIPGSGSTAMLLAALITIGVTPGPSLLEDANITIIFVVVIALVLANVASTSVCFALAQKLMLVSLIPAKKLVPFLTIVIVIAAYQTTRVWTDLVVLAVFGFVGWIMKRHNWSRPALLVGFVLGTPSERYLGIAYGRYGFDWLLDPLVIVIGVATVAMWIGSVAYGRRSIVGAPTASKIEPRGDDGR